MKIKKVFMIQGLAIENLDFFDYCGKKIEIQSAKNTAGILQNWPSLLKVVLYCSNGKEEYYQNGA